MKRLTHLTVVCFFVVYMIGLYLFSGVNMARAIECTFLNLLIPMGQDPSVVYHDGSYYLVQSSGNALAITKSDTITGLGRVKPVQVFVAPPGQPYSHDMWAPE